MQDTHCTLFKYSTSFSLWSTFLWILPLSSYTDLTLSYAVGDLVTRLLLSLLLTHSLNCLFIPFVLSQWELHCSCLKPLVLSKICSGWELICFHSRLQQFPEESGVDEQNYVVVSVRVSDSHQILRLPSPPSKYWTLPTEVTFVWLIRFCA